MRQRGDDRRTVAISAAAIYSGAAVVGIVERVLPGGEEFSILPAIVVTAYTLRRIIRDRYREWARLASITNGALAENIAGVRVTQAFVRERVNRQKFDELNSGYKEAIFSANRIAAAFG